MSPAGMQRFEGISDEHCVSEWNAYEQAWARAMERVGQFVSTRVQSEILDWSQQATRETLGKRLVDVHTLFESTTRMQTQVTLHEVYELSQQREQYRDGSWKARVVLLAPVEPLLADARQAEEALRQKLVEAEGDAQQTILVWKAQVRDEIQQADKLALLPDKHARLGDALRLYTQLKQAEASIQKAQQAMATRDGVEALKAYREVPLSSVIARSEATKQSPDPAAEMTAPGIAGVSPAPSVGNDMVYDVFHAYDQNWQALKESVALLESAQSHLQAHRLASAHQLLATFHTRMGEATGPFLHARTGELLSLPVLPSLLNEQLAQLQQQSQQALEEGRRAWTAGDLLTALQAWYRAQQMDQESADAAHHLAQAMERLTNARLEAEPETLALPYRANTETSVRVTLREPQGQPIPMPIAFRFKESGVEAEMITDLSEDVSSEGRLTLQHVQQAPSDATQLHLLATPAPRALRDIDVTLRDALASALDKQVLTIPVALLPTRQSLTLVLTLTGEGLSEEQYALFQEKLLDSLHQRGYAIADVADANSLEVQGELSSSSARVGPLVTLNLSNNLTFLYSQHPLAEDVRLNSGAQVGASEAEALQEAQKILLPQCVAEVETRFQQVVGIDPLTH